MPLKASLCACIILTFSCVTGDDGVFFKNPDPVEKALNSRVNFECAARGIYLVWLIDERPVTISFAEADLQLSYDAGNATSTLSLKALSALNNSAVSCRILSLDFTTSHSPPASITLQGILSPPHRVRRDATEDVIRLSWDAPHTLESVPIDNYTIEAINLNMSMELPLGFTSETTYNFTLHDSEDGSRCHTYQFSVSANNEVGKGNSSDPVEANFKNEPQVLDASDVITAVSINEAAPPNDSSIAFELLVPAEEYCKPASHYRIHAESIEGDTISIDASLITVLETGLSISFDGALSEFEENNKYSVVVETFTTEGAIGNSTGEFNISTFDVQQVKTITEMPPGNICLYCEFLNGSLARGCFVVMTMNSSTANNTGYKETNADSASVCISLVEGGEYNLSAFDIEQDGSTYTARAAVTTNVTVKGKDSKNMLSLIIAVPIASVGFVLLAAITIVLGVILQRKLYKQRSYKPKRNETELESGVHVTSESPKQNINEATVSDTKNISYGILGRGMNPNPAYEPTVTFQQNATDHIYDIIGETLAQ